jgi:hypothetical protein
MLPRKPHAFGILLLECRGRRAIGPIRPAISLTPRVANSTLHIPEAYSRVRVSLCLKEKLH